MTIATDFDAWVERELFDSSGPITNEEIFEWCKHNNHHIVVTHFKDFDEAFIRVVFDDGSEIVFDE